MSERRIVVTGIGVITPVGNTLNEFWSNLTEGKSGAAPITSYDTSDLPTKFACQVKDFNAAEHFNNPKDGRRADPYIQFAMAAAKQALADSGVNTDQLDLERAGIIIGSGIGGLRMLESQHETLLGKGFSRVSPFMIPMMISNIASGMVSMELGFKGPNYSIVSACASASHSIGEAARMIQYGDADIMLTGGTEAAIVRLGMSGFSAMKAISTRNDAPEKASRPWDVDRDGFVMGEGSGVVVLEEYEAAKKRGAKIYAELIGYGATADAHHLTAPAPEGEGAQRAMSIALKKAGIAKEEIQYINAHGTSTPTGDIAEAQAIRAVFGDHAKKLMVSSTKSMIGHLLGAAGAVEFAACLKTLETGIVHPTINLDNQDPECGEIDLVPNTSREANVETVMSNSFGFGGQNGCLIARKVS